MTKKASKSAEHKALAPEEEAEQAHILRDQNANGAYLFALDTPGCDMEALQEVVLVQGDGYDAILFARDIPGANIQALQKVILTRGSGRHAYWFAHEIPGADIQALQDVILARGENNDAYFFARDIRGADILACIRRAVSLNFQDGMGLLSGLQREHPEVFTPEVMAELSLGVIL